MTWAHRSKSKRLRVTSDGLVHNRMPDSDSMFPWCAQRLSLHFGSTKWQRKSMRFSSWVDAKAPPTCVRCLLLSIMPERDEEFFFL